VYLILTSRPGQFRTEPGDDMQPIEGYDYIFCGRTRAQYVIARLLRDTKVRIIEESTNPTVNLVPSKFLPKFDTIEAAREELKQLVTFGKMDIALVKLWSMIKVTFITNNGKVVNAPENSNLLRVSIRETGGIPFKCGGGKCGTCRCKIEHGLEHTDVVKDKERKHLSDADLAQGYRMACQTFINGDVSVSWIPLAERQAKARVPTV